MSSHVITTIISAAAKSVRKDTELGDADSDTVHNVGPNFAVNRGRRYPHNGEPDKRRGSAAIQHGREEQNTTRANYDIHCRHGSQRSERRCGGDVEEDVQARPPGNSCECPKHQMR